jgi:hypothetical protein
VRGLCNARRCVKPVARSPPSIRRMSLWISPLTPAFSPDGGEGEIRVLCACIFSHRTHQFFVARTPISFGSVRKTLVVSPESSLFRNVPVIAVSLNTFLS